MREELVHLTLDWQSVNQGVDAEDFLFESRDLPSNLQLLDQRHFERPARSLQNLEEF